MIEEHKAIVVPFMVILMCQSSNSHAKADDVRRTYSLQMMVWPSTDDVRLWSLSFNGSLVDSNAAEITKWKHWCCPGASSTSSQELH